MIIVHNEAGLGNQMMDWAEYYILKKNNPEQEVYLENVLFDIEECKNTVSMWNGYELDTLFSLESRTQNIKELLGENYVDFANYIRESKFWKDDWNYPKPIIKWLQDNLDISIRNCCSGGLGLGSISNRIKKKVRRIFNPVYNVKDYNYRLNEGNWYCGHSFPLLDVKYDYDEIFREELLDIFKFPQITIDDGKNYCIINKIYNTMSVGIHIRRGDLLVYNGKFYSNGYFEKAVDYIRGHVHNPIWFVFSDESSRDWCLENYSSIGLHDEDDIVFVEGNSGRNNYKDLQLLSSCKHQIITNSSFGWWGSYLNKYSDKITISPTGTFKTKVGL